MTSANIRLAESIKDDILSCPLCFEIFTDPKTLPCLHTYCKNCLLKLVENKFKKTRIIRCPECRAEVKLLKSGVDDLKSSFFIKSLMDIYDTKRQVVTCTVCKKRGDTRCAVSKCTTCGDGLCQQCSKGHLQSTITFRHIIVPLKDFASGVHDASLRKTQAFPCGEHQREFEFYCDSCEVVACLSCILLNHKDHQYTSANEAFDKKKEDLETMFREVQSKVIDIETAKGQVQELKSLANKKSLEVTKTITDTGQVVLNAVEKEIAETKENAEKVIKPRLERLKRISEDLDLKVKQGKNVVDFCGSILKSGKDVEILQLESLLRRRLKQLSQEESGVNISEIDFNNRIEDVFVNERFRNDVILGIFQPEPKQIKVGVCEADCQTEVSWLDIMTNGKQNASPCIPDEALFETACDSGLGWQTGSEELRKCDNLATDTSPRDLSRNYGNKTVSRTVPDDIRLRERERGEPAEATSTEVSSKLRPKGDNRFTDISWDTSYGTTNPSDETEPSPGITNYVITQVVILLFALVVLCASPILYKVLSDVINEL